MAAKKPTYSNQPLNYSMRKPHIDAFPFRQYQAYLLRIWREDQTAAWHVQLEDPHTNETIGFATLKKLMDFLDRQFKSDGEDDNVTE